MRFEAGNTYIEKVRLRHSAGDDLALRLCLEQALSGLRLQQHGLTPSAIVCFRRIRAPRLRVLTGPYHSVLLSPAWERTVVALLEQLVQHAARPVHGVVPANAEAVLFADYAEWLACLAGDWCEGNFSSRWWWQSLGKALEVPQVVIRAWLDAPEYVPAALQHLTRHGKAVLFTRSLSSNEANALVHSLTRRFALPELQTVLEAVFDANRQAIHSVGHASQTTGRIEHTEPPSTVHTAPHAAPWQLWVPESTDHGLRLEQQCVLGIGLMLQRAPTTLRAPSFASAVWQWQCAAPQPTSPRDVPGSASVASVPASTPTLESHARRVEMAHTAQGESVTPPTLSAQGESMTPPTLSAQPGGHIGSLVSAHSEVQMTLQTLSTGLVTSPPEHSQLPPDTTTPQRRVPGAERTTAMPALNQTSVSLEACTTQIDTALGGVFYLLNLGLFLHLYGDFTTPAQPGLPLPIWDFVALLGQQLVGEQIHADPVWSLLADLAGRDAQEAPGKSFVPPDVWRVPVAWLEPFPEAGLWHWDAAHGRLWVQHPEQFFILDVPREAGGPLQQLQNELHDYSAPVAFELRRAALAGSVHAASALERWLGWLMPYVWARLQRALGIADRDELARLVCEHPARVWVTATQLDIVLALETLPIALRLAGLDRDPGWVPAAGRYIAFHFE